MGPRKLKRIAPHLWQAKDSGYCYARFKCRLKRKPRSIPLGTDLKIAKEQLLKLMAKNIDRYDFDLDKQRPQDKPRDGRATPFTFSEWSGKYPELAKHKRSLGDDCRIIRLHLGPFFGSMLLTEINREALRRYIDVRLSQRLIRNKKGSSSHLTSRGAVSNELGLLRHMLRLANTEGFTTSTPSFDGLIVRVARGGRALNPDEVEKVLAVYDPWMRRLAEFASETCLSRGDLLRLTEVMIDEQAGVVVPTGGRKKTGVEHVAPLTDRCRAILQEIRAERRVIPMSGLIFTHADGSKITGDQIHNQVKKALKATGIPRFVFHNYRNTALTRWARQGVPVDVAMKASGHSSVQMHQRYVDLQRADVAKAFGTAQDSQKCNSGVTREKEAGRGA